MDTDMNIMPILEGTWFIVPFLNVIQAIVFGLVETRFNLQIPIFVEFPLVQTEIVGDFVTFKTVI